jgi:hypothetical protein
MGKKAKTTLICVAAVVIIAAAAGFLLPLAAKGGVQIVLFKDGKEPVIEPQAAPIVESGQVYIDWMTAKELLQTDCKYDKSIQMFSAVSDNLTIEIVAGEKTALVNGAEVDFDPPAKIVDDVFYLPLSSLAKIIGAEYGFDGKKAYVKVAPSNSELIDKFDGGIQDTSAKFTLITPYVNAPDIASIPWVYSEADADQPWAREVSDMRFLPAVDFAPFQAAASGTVEEVYSGNGQVEYNRIVRVTIRIDPNYVIQYIFNIAYSFPEGLEVQQANIFVKQGQQVRQGDIIGKLYRMNEHSHVSFLLIHSTEGGKADYSKEESLEYASPEFYFTEDAKASLQGVLNRGTSGVKLGYYAQPVSGTAPVVYKNNQKMAFDPPCVIRNNEMLISLSALEENFGMETAYDEAAKKVSARYAILTVRLSVQMVGAEPYVSLQSLVDGFGFSSYKFSPDRQTASVFVKDYYGDVNRFVAEFHSDMSSAHDSLLTYAGGFFYFGTTDWDQYTNTNFVYKLDKNLQKVWEYQVGELSVQSAVSPDSSGNLYFSAVKAPPFDPNNKFSPVEWWLYSLAPDGTFRWKKQISESYEVKSAGQCSCAIAKDDTIYVGNSKLYAFDKDGNLLWSYAGKDPDALMTCHCAPVLDAAGNVYFVTSEFSKKTIREVQYRIYCFAPGGALLWDTVVNGGFAQGKASAESAGLGDGVTPTAVSSPAITNDGQRLVVATGDTVHSLNTTDGKINWSLKVFDIPKACILAAVLLDAQNNVYVNTKCDDTSTIYAIKADGSGLLWKNNDIGSDLYCTGALGDDGKLYIGSEPQVDTYYTFTAVDLKTGEIQWHLGTHLLPMVNYTGVLIVDGYAYVLSNDPHNAYLDKIKIDAQGYLQNAWPCYHGGSDNSGRK